MALADCLSLPLREHDKALSNGAAPCDPQLISLKKVFDSCDDNRDGFLTLDELCHWMKKLGFRLTRDGLQEIVRGCDRNLDGRLDFDEFITLSASLGIPIPPTDLDRTGHDQASSTEDPHEPETTELQEAFLVFDKDCNGLISPSELRSTLSQLGLLAASTSFSRIHSMIRKVDTDGDGEVNFSEFQSMMKGIEGSS